VLQNTSIPVAAVLMVIALTLLLPVRADADSHPQEVLELIAAHHALAMKIRPLQDRIVLQASAQDTGAGFHPEGAPVRAKSNTATTQGAAGAENRVPGTIRHRDRAVAGDDYGRFKVRLSTLEQRAGAELERISRPGFGYRSASGATADESGAVRFGDGRHGTRPAQAAPPAAQAGPVAAQQVDVEAIAGARKALAELQREFAALEQEVSAAQPR